ncbi:Importin-11 [Chlorella vulgaris]
MAALGPSDLPAVFDCLRSALSHDPSTQKQAEATLHDLEARSGFCSCLAEILASKDADHSARWLAAVHFKNSCSKYWRSRLPGSLSEEEKAHLRGRLLSLVEQSDQQIAVQVAVVFSKVARLDFPKAWPTLFADLLAKLQGPGQLLQRRVYLVLHHILKELASKRLAADQRNFEQVTALLLEPTWRQWAADTSAVAAELPNALEAPLQAAQQLLVTFERWLLQLKALRRMVVFGFPSDARSLQQVPAVGQIAPPLLSTLQQFAGARAARAQVGAGAAPQRSQVGAMLDRAILKLLKTLRQIQDAHPWSFFHCGILAPCLDFCCGQVLSWQAGAARNGGGGGGPTQQFVVQSLLFVHGVQKCSSYRGSASSLSLHGGARSQLEQLKGLAAEVAPALAAFWSEARLQAFAAALVERLLPLTDKELEEWEDSPESFHQEMESTAWEDSMRGCAENTYLALFEGNREVVAPVVMQLLKAASDACPPGAPAQLAAGGGPSVRSVPAAVLAKEAAYQAVSVGAYELHDYVDFAGFLHNSLLPEMSDRSPAARPLRRRAIKLVSYWTARLKREDRPAVYRCLVAALGEERDAAMQLAAVASLRALVDDWEFEEAQFLEYVGPCFQQLAGLLGCAAEFDSQLAVFSLLDLIVDRLSEGVKPYAPGLLALLPSVWQQAEGQSLLRMQVLVALQRLVHSLGPESPSTYPMLLPVLKLFTDPHQPDELNLLEDGLQLWLVALRHAPAPCTGLLGDLFPNLVAAMTRSTEHIAVGMRIALSCVLLGQGEFLSAHGGGLVQVLCGFVGNVKDRGMLALMPVMDAVVQCFPSQGPQLLAPALQCLLADLLAGREPGLVVAAALAVYARVLLQNGDAFLQLFQQAAPHVAPPPDAPPAADPAARLLLALVDLWLDKFDSIGQPAARKLSALALCVLLTAPLPPLLERVELIATHITSVWFELEGSDLANTLPITYELLSGGRGSAAAVDDLHAVVPSEEAVGECQRRQALVDADPVANLKLSVFAKQQMEVAAGVHGGALQAALGGMDATLAGQLKAMLDSAAAG